MPRQPNRPRRSHRAGRALLPTGRAGDTLRTLRAGVPTWTRVAAWAALALRAGDAVAVAAAAVIAVRPHGRGREREREQRQQDRSHATFSAATIATNSWPISQ